MAQPVGTTTPRTPPWRYAVGMFGTSIPINMIRGSAIVFYIDLLGVSAAAYGSVMIVYAIIDALDNPLFGHLSDGTRTRFGRRRPWLLIGAPLLAASMIAFFSPPGSLDGVALLVWFSVFAILCEAFDSMINANYGALLPELFPRERDRAKANSLRQGFQLVALVISLAVTPLLTTRVLGTETSTVGFRSVAIIYAVVALAAIVLMALGARENPHHAAAPRVPFLRSVVTILRNPLFWKVGLIGACYAIPMALVISGVQLYVKYSLGLAIGGAATTLQAVVIGMSGIGLVVWTRVVQRRGALWPWRLAFPLLAASFLALYLARDLVTAIIAGAVLAVGWSGMLATNDLVVTRVLDADAAAHGTHREGLFLSAFGVLGRLNGAASGLAAISLPFFYGYVSGENPGPDPGGAWRLYMCVYPFVLTVIGSVAARFLVVPATAVAADAAVPGSPVGAVGEPDP